MYLSTHFLTTCIDLYISNGNSIYQAQAVSIEFWAPMFPFNKLLNGDLYLSLFLY